MEYIKFKPIGFISTPHKIREHVPIQPVGAKDIVGKIELFPEYEAGLKDLEEFSHLILIYYLHLSKGFKLRVMPFMENVIHGVFATRAPRRPNQIGFSIVRLEKIENNILHIKNVDMIDNTPLLDIKPFVPKFDCFDVVEKIGWLEKKAEKAKTHISDNRFRND